MKVIKRNVQEENITYAYDLLNKLRNGTRVFGKPAEGLKKTLRSNKTQCSRRKYYLCI